MDIKAGKKSEDELDEKQQLERNQAKAAEQELIEPEYLDEEVTGPMRYVAVVQNGVEGFVETHSRQIKWGAFILLVIAFHVYLGSFMPAL